MSQRIVGTALRERLAPRSNLRHCIPLLFGLTAALLLSGSALAAPAPALNALPGAAMGAAGIAVTGPNAGGAAGGWHDGVPALPLGLADLLAPHDGDDDGEGSGYSVASSDDEPADGADELVRKERETRAAIFDGLRSACASVHATEGKPSHRAHLGLVSTFAPLTPVRTSTASTVSVAHVGKRVLVTTGTDPPSSGHPSA